MGNHPTDIQRFWYERDVLSVAGAFQRIFIGFDAECVYEYQLVLRQIGVQQEDHLKRPGKKAAQLNIATHEFGSRDLRGNCLPLSGLQIRTTIYPQRMNLRPKISWEQNSNPITACAQMHSVSTCFVNVIPQGGISPAIACSYYNV